jgi:hypothetical protein
MAISFLLIFLQIINTCSLILTLSKLSCFLAQRKQNLHPILALVFSPTPSASRPFTMTLLSVPLDLSTSSPLCYISCAHTGTTCGNVASPASSISHSSLVLIFLISTQTFCSLGTFTFVPFYSCRVALSQDSIWLLSLSLSFCPSLSISPSFPLPKSLSNDTSQGSPHLKRNAPVVDKLCQDSQWAP